MTSNKRVFVGNLPPNVGEDDIRQEFSAYGDVTKIEIKEKKDVLNGDQVNKYAFININTDTWTLNKCIHEFAEQEWRGKYLSVALAKESFLERLQRERLEAQALKGKENKITSNSNESNKKNVEALKQTHVPKTENTIISQNENTASSEESSDSSESETEQKDKNEMKNQGDSDCNDDNDFIIKSNKHNSFLNPEKLKIPSYNPAIISQNNTKVNKTLEPQVQLAEQKRKQSLLEKKEKYHKQKMMLQKSLLKIDKAPKNKIIFSDDHYNKESVNTKSINNKRPDKRKINLFDEDDDGDEQNYQFDLKNQFEGKEGQKLLKLQSTFCNDKRFALDSRFLEEQSNAVKCNTIENSDSLDVEKQYQLKILENVLGNQFDHSKDGLKKDTTANSMLRYDPSKPDHNKFINKNEEKKHLKLKNKISNKINEGSVEVIEHEKPLVSEEKFSYVPENLKETFKQNSGFSLLSMFGNSEVDKVDGKLEYATSDIQKKPNNILDLGSQKNPFHYDSSDSEEEINGDINLNENLKNNDIGHMSNTGVWRENFFFIKGDQRLSDGIQFFTKFSLTDDNQKNCNEARRELKKVVKYKVLNNLRNIRPFKKKLGGHKIPRKVSK